MVTVKIVKADLFKNLENAIKTLNKKSVKVGWIEGNKYPYKSRNHELLQRLKGIYAYHFLNIRYADVAYVAEVAATHEFGAPSKNIPARPFIRPTIKNKENEWRDIALKKSKSVVKGKFSAHDLMELIGQTAVGDIRKTIKTLWAPPLKASTINARIRKYTNDPELSESTRKRRESKLNNKKIPLLAALPEGLYKPLIETGLMLATLTHSVEDE
jgi:hypothetical protein